jgi:hypothetical protein
MPGPEYGALVAVEETEERVSAEMLRLARDSGLRAKLGGALQRRIEERFSGKVWLGRLISLYR